MKNLKLVLILLVIVLAACSDKGEDVDYVNYRAAAGFSFEHPEGWVVEESNGDVNVASDASLFEADSTLFVDGGAANITTIDTELLSGNAVSSLDEFVGFMTTEEDASQVGETVSKEINGHNAAQAVLTVDNEQGDVEMTVTMVMGESQVVLIAAAYDGEGFGEILAHVAESVQFSE